MLTVIIKRNAEPTVIQMTQENIIKELGQINGSEMLLENTWLAGLKKVRTPFVCLVEADCVLSANYISSNVGLMKKTAGGDKGGGLTRLAMIASCLGVNNFANRIYSYRLERKEVPPINHWTIQPDRDKGSTKLYEAQVGFMPGAIIRFSSIKGIIDDIFWDHSNMVEVSTKLSFHLWNTDRIIRINPNTTYVSNEKYLEDPPIFDPEVPDRVATLFVNEGL